MDIELTPQTFHSCVKWAFEGYKFIARPEQETLCVRVYSEGLLKPL